jgi:hypothetical protein
LSLIDCCSEFDLIRSKAKLTRRFYRKMKRVMEIKQKSLAARPLKMQVIVFRVLVFVG